MSRIGHDRTEVLQRSAAYLAERGRGIPRPQCRIDYFHVLKKPRLRLYLEFDHTIPEADLATPASWFNGVGTPRTLQYLTGTIGFPQSQP